MDEEPGRALASSVPPSPCAFWITSHSFELPHCPSNQVLIDAQCDGIQLGAIEEGGGEELPLPAPVKPDVSLSTHPAYYLGCSAKGSSLLPDWPTGPAPSPGPPLQGHYSPFVTTTPQSAPVRRIRYSRLRLSTSAYSRSHRFPVRPRHDWFPSSVQEPTPRSCPLYAGHRLAKSEMTPPGLSQGRASGSDVMVLLVDASSEGSLSLNSVVHT